LKKAEELKKEASAHVKDAEDKADSGQKEREQLAKERQTQEKTRQEALDYLSKNNMKEGKGCNIVLRKGEDTRCAHYCSVNKFCSHWNNVAF